MPSETVDYGPVIADLESKIATLQGMVATLKAIAGGSFAPALTYEGAAFNGPSHTPIELPSGALTGKSLPVAIKLYLEAVKKKQTKNQIVTALKEGGFESTAASFGKAVSTTLHRLKMSEEILRFPDGGWALASLYPESFRARLGDQTAKSAKKPKKKRSAGKSRTKKGSQPEPSALKPSEVKTTDTSKGGIQQRALEILLSNPTRTFQPGDLSKQMNARVQTVAMLLGKMVNKGIIGRTGKGYHAPKQTAH